ncbi:MAG: DUF1905 domain-containing protein [Sphingorhabdus sp.]
MITQTYVFVATLWIWTSDKAPANWHFLTIEGDVAEALNAVALMWRLESGKKRGWGAVKVSATLGATSWDTSIFPSANRNGWLLPVKSSVRKAEGLMAGDTTEVTIRLR